MISGTHTITHKQFIFPTSADLLQKFVLDVMSFITENKTTEYGGDILSNVRLIIIELLTNGIKHSGVREVALDIEISDDQLKISKSDNGNPLSILLENGQMLRCPLPEEKCNTHYKIYSDDITSLYATANEHGQLSFKTIDYDFDTIEFTGTMLEHYGLVIMAKSSSKFTYSYADGENKFLSVINTR